MERASRMAKTIKTTPYTWMAAGLVMAFQNPPLDDFLGLLLAADLAFFLDLVATAFCCTCACLLNVEVWLFLCDLLDITLFVTLIGEKVWKKGIFCLRSTKIYNFQGLFPLVTKEYKQCLVRKKGRLCLSFFEIDTIFAEIF